MTSTKRILVVEDDVDLAKILCRLLEHEGYGCTMAPDGAAALRHLDSETVDLVVTDLMMPGMEGEELLTELRKRQASRLPVILISASAVREQVADRLGVEASLAKPFDTEELRQLVASILETETP